MAGRRRAAFFDRDGTLVEDVHYARTPEQIVLLPGVRETLAALKREGFCIIVATNQSGVARGLLTEDDLAAQHRRLAELLGPEAAFDAVYYCPHLSDAAVAAYRVACECRKPKPGLFLRAAREHGIDLAASIAVGDKARDHEAAAAAGVARSTVLAPGGAETLGAAVARVRA